MNPEQFVQSVFHAIWQGHHLDKFDDYYAKDVRATMSVSKDSAKVDDVTLDYQGILEQAKWQKENYRDFEFDFKTVFGSNDHRHITLYLFSKGVNKATAEMHHFRVCACYELNEQHKIKRCCGVMTPYYPFTH